MENKNFSNDLFFFGKQSFECGAKFSVDPFFDGHLIFSQACIVCGANAHDFKIGAIEDIFSVVELEGEFIDAIMKAEFIRRMACVEAGDRSEGPFPRLLKRFSFQEGSGNSEACVEERRHDIYMRPDRQSFFLLSYFQVNRHAGLRIGEMGAVEEVAVVEKFFAMIAGEGDDGVFRRLL